MKSLFGKLLIIYIAIILIGFIFLTLIMSQSFEDYFIKEKERALIQQAQNIEKEYQRAFRTGVVDLDRVDIEMQALAKYLNARIWLISRQGKIYISSKIEDLSMIEKELKYHEIQRVFSGEIIKREGYFREFFDEPVLTIGYPIKINDRAVFALFMHASIPEINKTISDIYRIAFVSLTVSTVIAIALLFIISRQISNQIKDLNNAVKVISKGNFQKRIRIKTKDEFGELAANVNDMANELSNLEEMRRRFISNLSHDLRTPLTTINGFVNAILDGTIEETKQRKYLKIVAEESERLTRLTNNILDLSKMESGELKLERSNFNINELLINEIDKFEEAIEKKRIEVKINLVKDSMVEGDINQIKRVINNLIDNAVKFVNEGGEIEISTYSNDGKIYISIRNTGVILTSEELNHIWERFNKLDYSRGKDKSGSGLGLSIVKELIKSHGESIRVISGEDIGVKFIFSLPKVQT